MNPGRLPKISFTVFVELERYIRSLKEKTTHYRLYDLSAE